MLEQVRQLKQKLRSVIGWYHSVNALAHITFNVFEAHADELSRWEAYVSQFAAAQLQIPLQFNRTRAFGKGAFVLMPSESSEQVLTKMMETLHREAPSRAKVKTTKPHMSIGRGLKPEQLSTARTLIPEADIHFVCSDIVLRRLNEARMQYDIYRRFDFGMIGEG